jgi:hypothetical protein
MEVPEKREIHLWLCLKWQQLWNRMASKPVSSNSAIKPYKVALPVTSATNWEDAFSKINCMKIYVKIFRI